MTMDQIALAAECISAARIQFLENVVVEPLLTIMGGKQKKGAETGAQRQKKQRQKGRKWRGERSRKVTTREGMDEERGRARDARNMALAQRMGMLVN